MGSHRPPSRVWSSGLRVGAGPDGEDDGPVWTPSPTSRNYLLSMRPEISLSSNRFSHPSSGRSTFCSIIAQLTEETQPLFETTLKSRAVSADCDARFTCIVTGYPEPEVTWYKDDEELDRYCGLPKYEISQQGNRHTLQLYKCQEEDAAIYQASARNAKGIVSCSGVLEVGTMTEYKIHQRWFAKLKRKAEAKMREIEQSRKYGKEMVSEADTVRKLSPDRFQRKRRLSGAREQGPSVSCKDLEDGALEPELEGETSEPPWSPAIGLANSFTGGEVTTNGDATLESGEESGDGVLSYLCEAVELISQRPPTKESVAKKKKKEEGPSRKGTRTSEQKPEGARTSENHIPTTAESDSSWTRGHMGAENTPLAQRESSLKTSKLDRADRTLESTSVVAQEARSSNKIGVKIGKDLRAPTPDGKVYFSLKDMYLENTQSAATDERLQTPSGSPQSGISLGALPGRETGKEKLPPGQPVSASAQQPPRVFNRKRFAPPKPKCDPSNDSQPCASVGTPSGILGSSAQQGAQPLGISPEPAATVPTPPARRKHKTRESPAQKPIAYRTPCEGLETQVAQAPATSADSSSAAECLSHNLEGEQGSVEPMDVETQEEERMKKDRRTPMDVSAQMESMQEDVRTQEDSRTRIDLRTQADVNRQLVGRIHAGSTHRDGRSQVVTVTQSEWQSSHDPKPTAPTEAPQRLSHFKRLPTESSHPSQIRSEETQIPALGNMQSLPGPLGPEAGVRPVAREGSRGLGEPGPTKVDKVARQSQGELPRPTEEPISEASMEGSDPVVEVTLGLASDSYPTSPISTKAPSIPSPKAVCLPNNTQEEQVKGGPTEVAEMPFPEAAQTLGHSDPKPQPHCEALERVGTPSQGHHAETEAAMNRGNALGACGDSEPEVRGAGPRASSPVAPDSGLIDSLKNYLLLLLKLSSADTDRSETEARGRPEGQQPPAGGPGPPDTLAPTVEIAGLSPRTSRKILERVENNHLIQSARSLQLSPCTSRRLTGLIDQEVQSGQKALAAGKPLGRYLSPLTVPTIVVGEETQVQGPETSNKGAAEEIRAGQKESRMGESLWISGDQGVIRMGEPLGESKREEPFQDAELSGDNGGSLPGATPEELALGARRKRFLPKAKVAGEGETPAPEDRESPTVSPRGSRKSLAPGSPLTPPKERHSPSQNRKMLEVPRADEDSADLGSGPKGSGPDTELAPEDSKQDETAKPRKTKDHFKAPQVIRKIRVEQFPDASGSLKLWCQFFNILSDSVLTWAKDQLPVAEVERSVGDEGPVALAIVQASPRDCGVYQCAIRNEHGTDSTNFCLSPEVLSGFISREEVEVGEEIEMTPMVFAKGLADSGCWGDKLFGRLVSGELRGSGRGRGLRKASQAKVIYGLEPIFESGRTCVIKVPNLLVFGSSNENSLLGRNYDVTIQGCKIQNMSREYCKIFAAEARAVPGFGEVPEIIPLYLIYRPANSIPYATLEEYLGRPLEPYCARDWEIGSTQAAPAASEAAQKCRTFQHWLYQWTNGSFLVTDLAGVDWKMTDVQIATKLKGYQGLKESCFPGLLEQFAVSHQCNTHCEMLGLKSLKSLETLYPMAKAKGSKSPSSGRKAPSATQLSPQLQKKGHPSPQGSRKSTSNLKAVPRSSETADTQLNSQPAAQERGFKAQGM
ncbi:alpha-protein kinase 3 isoform X1 [Vombatus ursinus]|uniref:alpha-protein kinase 3 isoform X1 n=1 Tax=Vombatus ursinus TaxID=29139 RepID=UPI000FFDBD50|nr:alpha-protein kinase 3 isoform X1 [Vombatus ursinus]